jgi:predicted ATPase
MKIKSLRLENIKGFIDSGNVTFSKSINIIIGTNNSGKSTLINSINNIQSEKFRNSIDANVPRSIELRKGTQEGLITISISDMDAYLGLLYPYTHSRHMTADEKRSLHQVLSAYSIIISEVSEGRPVDPGYPIKFYNGDPSRTIPLKKFLSIEPYNILYPFLAKRKNSQLINSVNSSNIKEVTSNFEYLIPKIDSLYQRSHKHHDAYMDICQEILGFHVVTEYDESNKQAGLLLYTDEMIPITSMGEGIMHLLGLIVNLCTAENKIFLIEEPENDIHPKALKAILSLIQKKSDTNQFIISTHSNIVAKYLGGIEDAKLFKVSMDIDNDSKIPVSSVVEVSNNIEERQAILEELGYDFFDFNLWKGWLFLEEASAESIIKDYLIPIFTPELSNVLRTFSTSGVNQMSKKVDDFHRLFIYLHLTEIYKNKVWVIADAGANELEEINKIRDIYVNKHNWNSSRFRQFSKNNFEEFYPDIFKEDVLNILSMPNGKAKTTEKANLVKKILLWTKQNRDLAESTFSQSAKEVIDILKEISIALA